MGVLPKWRDPAIRTAPAGGLTPKLHLNGKNYNMNHSGQGVINPSSQLNMEKMGFQRGEHIGALIIKFKIEFLKFLSILLSIKRADLTPSFFNLIDISFVEILLKFKFSKIIIFFSYSSDQE